MALAVQGLRIGAIPQIGVLFQPPNWGWVLPPEFGVWLHEGTKVWTPAPKRQIPGLSRNAAGRFILAGAASESRGLCRESTASWKLLGPPHGLKLGVQQVSTDLSIQPLKAWPCLPKACPRDHACSTTKRSLV